MSEFILGIFLLTIWNTILFFGHKLGLSVLLFMIPTLILIVNILKKKDRINNKYGLLFIIPILLLSITYVIFNNQFFSIINIIIIPILFLLMYIYTAKPTYNIGEIFNDMMCLIFEPLECIGSVIRLTSNKLSSFLKMNQKQKRIIKSLLIVVPVTIIIIVLLSDADIIFAKMFSTITKFIKSIFDYEFFDTLVSRIILMFIFYIYTASSINYLLFKYPKETPKRIEKYSIQRDNFTIKLLLTVLNIIYILFDFIQIRSLLLHHVGSINYASYARQGFFELLVVSFINLLIILISKKFEDQKNNKNNTYTKIMSIVMVILTSVIILSSFLRMNLYESAYGYTLLRLLVYITLITEAALLIPTIAYIINSKFNVIKSYMIILIFVYVAANFINIDYIIAKRNINRYYEQGKIDLHYLENYATDNISLLNNLYNNTDEEEIKDEIKYYFSVMKDNCKTEGFQEYNISKENAKAILEEY